MNQTLTTTDNRMVEIYRFCTGCKTHRLLDQFSLNRSKNDGLSGWCKICHRADAAVRRRDPRYRAVQSAARAKWLATERGNFLRLANATRYRANHPEKIICRRKVRDAIANGNLKRQPCFCGDQRSHAHHEDYNKPLEVIWLCAKHHTEIHERRNR